MHRRLASRALLLLACCTGAHSSLAGCAGSSVQPGPLTESPLALRRVVLYRNGVGYFERHGKLSGDTLKLKVRKDQINDLLKSLTVVDRGDGKVLGVSIPLDPRALHELALETLTPGQGKLAEILDRLRGTRISVETQWRSATGRIVMVERVLPAKPDPKPMPERGSEPYHDAAFEDYRLTLLDGEQLSVVLLSEIITLTIEDGDVVMQLDRRLDASAGEGMFQQVDLTLRLSGANEHDLALSYVAPAPLWKPTYRIVLDEKKPGQALLQAWAVVDNTSGETWRDVQLSLTSGAPIAFQYDLHTPRDVQRPDLSHSGADKQAAVALGERTYDETQDAPAPATAMPDAAPAPMEPEAQKGYAESDDMDRSEEGAAIGEMKKESAARRPAKSGRGSAGPMASAAAPAAPPPPPAVSMEALQASVAAQARAQRVAGLTRFDLTDRVTLPDGSSTMVTIINQLVKGEQVFLYRPGGSGQGYEQNPYRVVRFRNDTEFVLEPGPISIYSSGSFVGEGLSEAISSRDTATIPFAVEPTIMVRASYEAPSEQISTVKLVRGVLEVEAYERATTVWSASGPKQAAAYRVLIRHPRRGGNYKLVEPPPGVEELPDAYFVPLLVAAGAKEGSVKVTEQTPKRISISIWDGQAEQLLDTLLAAKDLDAALRAKLQPIVDKRREMGRIDTEIDGLQTQQSELNERVSETRESLRAIQRDPRAGALRSKLGERLDAFLRDADAAGRKIVELQSKRLELKIELEDLLQQDLGTGK
ncbi:MAG TPA: hypothetical protein VK509_02340 [Polyangiales bacterium]|nr:hypothetical protein [Polyangiales bacterium]